jgi:hypothetical protein
VAAGDRVLLVSVGRRGSRPVLLLEVHEAAAGMPPAAAEVELRRADGRVERATADADGRLELFLPPGASAVRLAGAAETWIAVEARIPELPA